MLTKILGSTTVRYLFLGGYCLFAAGLPFNKIVLSLSAMFVFLLTLLELNPKRDWQLIKSNKPLLLVLLFLAVHLLSLFWTENYSYFFKDFNTKLPLYALPIVLVLHPVRSSKDLSAILYFFIASVLVISVYNFTGFYANYQAEKDLREMSQFVSHIRFGLMIVFAIVCCVYLLFTRENKLKWILIPIIGWLLVYTYAAEVFNAYLALAVLIFSALFWIFFKTYSRKKAWILTTLVSTFLLLSGIFLLKALTPPKLDAAKLEKFTKQGHPYKHYTDSRQYINGHHVYSYICVDDLHYGWQDLSSVSLYDTNQLGFQHYYTLIQYMSSKGLRKDNEGLKKLTSNDVKRILKGTTNAEGSQYGFFRRLETLRNEFYDDNPNGKTVKQRLEYVKTGWHIFAQNPIIGVGSGDLQDAFDKQYVLGNSKLLLQNRLRAHNQILTYFISFGIIGGLLFVFLLVFTLVLFVRKSDWLSALFLCLLIFSFLSEDTLETQMGVSFFALFFGIFIGMKSTTIRRYKYEN